MDPIKATTTTPASLKKTAESLKPSATLVQKAAAERPVLPPEIPQYFMPIAGGRPAGQNPPVFQPMILGSAQVHFANAKARIDFTKDMVFLTPATNDPVPVRWDQAKEARVSVSNLKTVPPEGAQYSELPPATSRVKNYDLWQRDFAGWLVNTQRVELFRSPSSGEYSRPGETERDFRVRLQLNSKEERDKFADELQKKYASRFSSLDERIGRAKLVLAQQSAQSRQQKFDVAASIGSALLGSFLGGRKKSVTSSISRSFKESGDVKSAEATLHTLQEQRLAMEKQFQAEISDREKKTDPLTENLDKVLVSPTRSDVSVRLVALTWVPA
jgi:hypothetical protein